MFSNVHKPMEDSNVAELLEEGAVVIAQSLFEKGQHLVGLSYLARAKTPNALFAKAMMLHTLASMETEGKPHDEITVDTLKKQGDLLDQSKHTLFLTMESIAMEQTNPLHEIIQTLLEEIEAEQASILEQISALEPNHSDISNFSSIRHSSFIVESTSSSRRKRPLHGFKWLFTDVMQRENRTLSQSQHPEQLCPVPSRCYLAALKLSHSHLLEHNQRLIKREDKIIESNAELMEQVLQLTKDLQEIKLQQAEAHNQAPTALAPSIPACAKPASHSVPGTPSTAPQATSSPQHLLASRQSGSITSGMPFKSHGVVPPAMFSPGSPSPSAAARPTPAAPAQVPNRGFVSTPERGIENVTPPVVATPGLSPFAGTPTKPLGTGGEPSKASLQPLGIANQNMTDRQRLTIMAAAAATGGGSPSPASLHTSAQPQPKTQFTGFAPSPASATSKPSPTFGSFSFSPSTVKPAPSIAQPATTSSSAFSFTSFSFGMSTTTSAPLTSILSSAGVFKPVGPSKATLQPAAAAAGSPVVFGKPNSSQEARSVSPVYLGFFASPKGFAGSPQADQTVPSSRKPGQSPLAKEAASPKEADTPKSVSLKSEGEGSPSPSAAARPTPAAPAQVPKRGFVSTPERGVKNVTPPMTTPGLSSFAGTPTKPLGAAGEPSKVSLQPQKTTDRQRLAKMAATAVNGGGSPASLLPTSAAARPKIRLTGFTPCPASATSKPSPAFGSCSFSPSTVKPAPSIAQPATTSSSASSFTSFSFGMSTTTSAPLTSTLSTAGVFKPVGPSKATLQPAAAAARSPVVFGKPNPSQEARSASLVYPGFFASPKGFAGSPQADQTVPSSRKPGQSPLAKEAASPKVADTPKSVSFKSEGEGSPSLSAAARPSPAAPTQVPNRGFVSTPERGVKNVTPPVTTPGLSSFAGTPTKPLDAAGEPSKVSLQPQKTTDRQRLAKMAASAVNGGGSPASLLPTSAAAKPKIRFTGFTPCPASATSKPRPAFGSFSFSPSTVKPLPSSAKPATTCSAASPFNGFSTSAPSTAGVFKPAASSKATLHPAAAQPKKQSSASLKAKLTNEYGSWDCDACYSNNAAESPACVACTAPKAVPTSGAKCADAGAPSTSSALAAKFADKPESWDCDACYTNNVAKSSACTACTAPKPGRDPKPPTGASTSTGAVGGAFASPLGLTLGSKPSGACTGLGFESSPTAGSTTGSGVAFKVPAGFSLSGNSSASKSSTLDSTTTDGAASSSVAFKVPAGSSLSSQSTPFTGLVFDAKKDDTHKPKENDGAIKAPSTGFTFCAADSNEAAPSTSTGATAPGGTLVTDKFTFGKYVPTFFFGSNDKSKSDAGFAFGQPDAGETKEGNPWFTFGKHKPQFSFGGKDKSKADSGFSIIFPSAKPDAGETKEGYPFSSALNSSISDSESKADASSASSTPSKPALTITDIAKSQGLSFTFCMDLDEKVEHVEDVNFKPIFQMPEDYEVRTGEEGEEVKFSHRAKLYRYDGDAKAWKERGVHGDIKVLYNSQDCAYRIVMRREQSSISDSKSKADASSSASSTPSKPALSFTDIAKSQGSSFTSCKDLDEEVEHVEDVYFKPIFQMPEDYEVRTGEKGEEGKFSHRAKLYRYDGDAKAWKERGVGDIKVLYNSQDHAYRIIMRREQVFKVCANHLITSHIELCPNSGSDRSWVWSAMDASEGTVQNEQLAVRFRTADTAKEFKEAVNRAKEDLEKGGGKEKKTDAPVAVEVNPKEERDIYFQPIVKLPDNVDIVTGEEQEVAAFVGRGKLYRFDGGARQWKERGVGDMKIMKEEETDVYRIVMRRDQIHKVCANHYITSSMALHPMAGSDRAWVWHAMDAADGEPTSEQLAIKFKDPSIAASFKEMFEEAQAKIRLQEAADDGGQTGSQEEGGAASSSSSTSHAGDGVAKATPSSKDQLELKKENEEEEEEEEEEEDEEEYDDKEGDYEDESEEEEEEDEDEVYEYGEDDNDNDESKSETQ